MSTTAEKTDPKLWSKVKDEVVAGDKGGKPGQWSARKAQMATSEYKKEGGGYKGGKSKDNHLTQWTDEEWGTKSGEKSKDTGERYLPKDAREHLSAAEYKHTTDKKRADTKKGLQYSAQPKEEARKTKPYRSTGKATAGKKTAAKGSPAKDGPSKAELYAKAKAKNVAGRSKMSLEELRKAVA